MNLFNQIKLKWKSLSISIIAGAGLGYAYFYFIGCNSGSCAITSNPFNSTAYGALVGLVWTFPSKKKRVQE